MPELPSGSNLPFGIQPQAFAISAGVSAVLLLVLGYLLTLTAGKPLGAVAPTRRRSLSKAPALERHGAPKRPHAA